MPIDPTVALQAGVGVPPPSPGINLGQIAGAANAILQLQDEQRARQTQNALQQLMQSPDALDKSGMPTQNTLAQVMQINPQIGMQMQQNMARRQLLQSEAYKSKMGLVQGVLDESYGIYESTQGNEQAKIAAGQRKMDEGYDRLEKGGQLTKEDMQSLPRNFVPESVFAVSARLNTMYGKQREEYRKNEELRIKQEELKLKQKSADEEQKSANLSIWQDPDTKQIFRVNKATKTIEPIGAEEEGAKLGKPGAPAQASSEDEDNTAKLIASYQMAPMSTFAMSRPEGVRVMGKVKKINPDYQSSRYTEVNRTMTAFGTGKQGDIVRSINVAAQHLDVMVEAANALHSGNMPAFNAAGQLIARWTGRPAPTNFDGLRQIVSGEILKASAGGVLAEADRDRLIGSLNRINSPAQLQKPGGIIDEFLKLMGGQAQGLRQQYEDATPNTAIFRGDGEFSFDHKLLPETRRQLDRVSGAQTKGAAGEGGGKQYKSLADVQEALKANQMSRSEAEKIARDNGWIR